MSHNTTKIILDIITTIADVILNNLEKSFGKHHLLQFITVLDQDSMGKCAARRLAWFCTDPIYKWQLDALFYFCLLIKNCYYEEKQRKEVVVFSYYFCLLFQRHRCFQVCVCVRLSM